MSSIERREPLLPLDVNREARATIAIIYHSTKFQWGKYKHCSREWMAVNKNGMSGHVTQGESEGTNQQ
jgi:hypothetical protein